MTPEELKTRTLTEKMIGRIIRYIRMRGLIEGDVLTLGILKIARKAVHRNVPFAKELKRWKIRRDEEKRSWRHPSNLPPLTPEASSPMSKSASSSG